MIFIIILSVLPMFVALYWIIVLLNTRYSNYSKRFLAFFLSLSVVNYFVHATYFNYDYELYGFMENFWIFTSLVGYPLYYYYIRLLTRDEKIDWKWIWIIMPSLGLSVFSFWLYFNLSKEEFDTFIHGIMYHEDEYSLEYTPLVRLELLKGVLFKIISIIQVILSLYFGIRLITKYNREVKDFYSNISGKDLSKAKWVLYAFIFASVVSVISSALGKEYFIDRGWLLFFPSITHSAFLWFIGYVGYHQDFTVGDFKADVEDYNNRHAESIFKKPVDFRGNLNGIQLNDLVIQNELFKNPNLRITDLAVLAATNRTYISRVINDEFNTNFNDWINSFRVENARSLLEGTASKEMSIIEIGEKSGFSSQSVFYRVFKEKYHVAPGLYRESLLNAVS